MKFSKRFRIGAQNPRAFYKVSIKVSWLFGLVLGLAIIPQLPLAAQDKPQNGFIGALDTVFSKVVAVLDKILFFEVAGFPLIVLWLIGGAIFFTFRLGFINVRAFKHAVDIVRGKYDDPDDEGDVTHFQALTTALSGTVGLGNIAGVAIAIQLGGPGAVLWMTLGGFFGMSSKFTECTLAQKYRRVKPGQTVAGGPMYYLSQGLAERGLRPLGKGLALVFAIFCILASFGVGNLFQSNQSYAALSNVFSGLPSWIFGLVLAGIVAVVIIGGISRIASVTSKLVPAMAIIYVLACLWIIVTNIGQVPGAFGTIISQAFSPQAVGGGFVGVLVQGIRRSAFSNEAGIGSAAIAHSAARTKEAVREGLVALLEPFFDTILICNLTALTIVITGVYQGTSAEQANGVEITSAAFDTVIDWFPSVLAVAVVLFAFSTMISWSYYGEQAWTYMLGQRSTIVYKCLFVFCVFVGAVVNLGAILDFSDMMLLAMSVPNLLGCFILSGLVASELKDYLERLHSGEMLTYDEKERGSARAEEEVY